MHKKPKYDAVVIGSGHNGLVAAAYLAKAGKSVLVIEKNDSFGGATASQRVFPDYDALLSRYSYLVSLLPNKILNDLGLRFETRRREIASFTPWIDSGGSHRGLVLSNVDAAKSRDAMLQLIGQHATWNRYQEFLSLQSEMAKLVWPTMLEPLQAKQSFESRLATRSAKAAWHAFVQRPLGESIEQYIDHDVLRGLVLTDGKIGVFTHAHDTSLLQNRCFLYHVIGNETGEWRVPVGGMKSLVDALLDRCRSLGVELISSAQAEHISVGPSEHEVTYITEAGEQLVRAKNVLINAGPKTYSGLLQQPWLPAGEDEGSVVKVNMLLHRLPRLKTSDATARDAFSGSFHIDEGYEQMQASWDMARCGNLPDPAPGEVYCHTLTDATILSPELRQKGFHTLTLFGLDMPWRLFGENHGEQKKRIKELYLKGLNNLCDEPFEDCLAADRNGEACIEVKTALDLQAELDLDQGNIFHNALSWFYGTDDQVGSWGVETDFPRVYRAGASAMRGGAVSGIPGHNAAMCILEGTRGPR